MENRRSEFQATNVPPRLMIAATQGRSGKTTISIGICAALRQRGLSVQPFKKGPDYIDPSWLGAAAGRCCRNLDAFVMPEEEMLSSFQRACLGVDLGIIEGAMGLYDSFYPDGRGSSAHLARLLQTPVILIVNTTRMTRSVAAMVKGYQNFEPQTTIVGVILNNVSGKRHEHKLVEAIEHYCGMPILGAVSRDPGLQIAERHLGLMPIKEGSDTAFKVEKIQRGLEKYLNLDAILAVALGAHGCHISETHIPKDKAPQVQLGVLFDRAFTFYYPENLEALQRAGAYLMFIDSLNDRSLPPVDGLYIGGGFPEFFLEELEANNELRQDIAEAIEGGLPVYAECAGLMYLCRGIKWQGKLYEMVGAISGDIEIYQRPQGHGYVSAEVTRENPLLPIGLTIRGHEFHHSKLINANGLMFAYRMRRGHGIDGVGDGIVYKNLFAAYTHLHALGTPQWAEAFVSLALQERKSRPSFSGQKCFMGGGGS